MTIAGPRMLFFITMLSIGLNVTRNGPLRPKARAPIIAGRISLESPVNLSEFESAARLFFIYLCALICQKIRNLLQPSCPD
jgi:hypothetical protein